MKVSLLNASYPLKAPSWAPKNEINPPCHLILDHLRLFYIILQEKMQRLALRRHLDQLSEQVLEKGYLVSQFR